MAATSEKSDPKLWDKVKQDVKNQDKAGKPGQWSARKAQMAVQEYKSEGGGYKGGKSADNHLVKWTKEDAAKTRKSKAGESKAGASKASLLQAAAAKKIKGRSRMTKAQLEEALHSR